MAFAYQARPREAWDARANQADDDDDDTDIEPSRSIAVDLTSITAEVGSTVLPLVPAGYDYEALGPRLAGATRTSVAIIHEHIRRTGESLLVIGMEGVRLRKSLPYGEFMKVVAAEYGPGFWNTLNKCINIYERMGGERFHNLRNLVRNRTTLYALAKTSTPHWLRCEIADAIDSGAAPKDGLLDAWIVKRLKEARAEGVLPQSLEKEEASVARRLRRRDNAIAAARLCRERMSERDWRRFNELLDNAGDEWDQVRHAREADYVRGFVSPRDVPIDIHTGLPLSDRQLEDHVIARATDPSSSSGHSRNHES
jgi:hypothetical protein